MYLPPDRNGWLPGDPTPEQIFKRTAECHEFRRLGIPVPEVRSSVRALPLKGRELAVDLLAEGVKPSEVARRMGVSVYEIQEIVDDFKIWAEESDAWRCPTCRVKISTNICVRCAISSVA